MARGASVAQRRAALPAELAGDVHLICSGPESRSQLAELRGRRRIAGDGCLLYALSHAQAHVGCADISGYSLRDHGVSENIPIRALWHA